MRDPWSDLLPLDPPLALTLPWKTMHGLHFRLHLTLYFSGASSYRIHPSPCQRAESLTHCLRSYLLQRVKWRTRISLEVPCIHFEIARLRCFITCQKHTCREGRLGSG